MREDSKEAKENRCDFIKGDHHILIRFVSQRNIKTFVEKDNIENRNERKPDIEFRNLTMTGQGADSCVDWSRFTKASRFILW